ncbi:MAG: hypothetical protein AB1700_17860 [Bacillota bacterium]
MRGLTAFSGEIVSSSLVGIKGVWEVVGTACTPENMRGGFLEFLCYFLHCIDRVAFAALGPDGRGRVMDAVVYAVTTFADESGMPDLTRQQIVRRYNERNAQYEPCRLAAEGNKGLAGTLVWEFGKNVAASCGKPMDMVVITTASHIGNTLFGELNALECVRAVSSHYPDD